MTDTPNHNKKHLKKYRKELRNSLTNAEAKLWLMLKKRQVGGRKFRRQHSIDNFIVDFYCPEEKLVIEIEALEKEEQKKIKKIEKRRVDIANIINGASGNLTKLEDITSKIGSGATPRGGKGAYQESGISLIRSQNVYDYGVVRKGLAFINKKQAQKLENVRVEKNDILFNITGASIARCCLVEDKYLPARVNQHVSIIRVNEKSLPKYVQMVLISTEYKAKLWEIGEGGTSRQSITKTQLGEFKIPLPLIKEQQKIVLEIETIESEITALEIEIAEISKEKEAILKKYLE